MHICKGAVQVPAELCTVIVACVLSVLGTLLAVRWIGTPLRVRLTCAEAPAAGLALARGPGLHAADMPIFGASNPVLRSSLQDQVAGRSSPHFPCLLSAANDVMCLAVGPTGCAHIATSPEKLRWTSFCAEPTDTNNSKAGIGGGADAGDEVS